MQLRKYYHKLTRNRNPCVICLRDHPTWQHGKSDEQISQEIMSRKLNPRDPINNPLIAASRISK